MAPCPLDVDVNVCTYLTADIAEIVFTALTVYLLVCTVLTLFTYRMLSHLIHPKREGSLKEIS